MARNYGQATSGLAGGLGGIPGLNIFTPGLANLGAQQAQAALRDEMIDNAYGIKAPEFDARDFQQVQYAGDVRPDMYGTPEAATYETISEDPRTREMAMQALQRMQGFVDQNASGQEALGRQQSLDAASQMAGSREGAIRAQAARRGQSGAGLDMVLQQQAAQAGAGQAQQGMLNANAQAALQRMMGTQGVMQGASQMRGQDADIAARNAAIINAFNMYNVGQRNMTNQANVDARNQAQYQNRGARQGVMGQNTGINNAGIMRNDQNAMNKFGAAAQRVGMINSALGGGANAAHQSGADGIEAGKVAYDNYKSMMSSMGGSMGGMGGIMGGK